MALSYCVVSGNVTTLLGQGLNGVTIKAYTNRPFFYPDGTQILNFEVSTTSNSSGNWSLTLVETATANAGAGIPISFALEFVSGGSGLVSRKEYTCIIPNTPTASFSTLIAGQT